MSNIEKFYAAFHKERMGVHCYPNEVFVRTMLGSYPGLRLEHNYEGANILDLGCGDGRNLPLLHNVKAKVFGVEITQEICDAVQRRMAGFGIDVTMRCGCNAHIPFDDGLFDYIIASSSLYYVDEGETFEDTLCEVNRVLKKGGCLIATLPHPTSFIFQEAVDTGNTHYKIVNDPHGLRNGNILKLFETREQIMAEFSQYFSDIALGETHDDYFGYEIGLWIFVGKKHAS